MFAGVGGKGFLKRGSAEERKVRFLQLLLCVRWTGEEGRME